VGTSGTGLFADDVACDVREEFVERLRWGDDPMAATQAMLRSHLHLIDDVDDGPVFWLALAATQWKYGCLADDVRARAVTVIDSGADLARWSGAAASRRQAVLAALREQLHAAQPPLRRPRRRRPLPAIPSVRVASPDGTAVAVASQLDGHGPDGPRTQVTLDVIRDGEWSGGGHVALLDCEYDEVALGWIAAETLQIGHPASASLINASASFYYAGRMIAIAYRAIGR
jgi:hypothetical protein